MRSDNLLVVCIVGVALLFASCGYYALGTQDVITRKVTEKENVVHGDSSRYIIYVDGGEPLENTDTLFYGKFNSSTVYSRIKEGSCYRFKVYGWRVPFFSWYQNIVDYEKVGCEG